MSEIVDTTVVGTPEEIQKEIQYQAFRKIRHFVCDFQHEDLTNDEIAGYVKGVCDLEVELKKEIDRLTYDQLNKSLDKF